MAKRNEDRDSGDQIEVCGIFALLLYAATYLQRVIASLRERAFPGYPLVRNNDGDGKWRDLGNALAMPSAFADLRIPPNIDQEGQYNVRLVDQPPAAQEPEQNIDAENAAAAEADLERLLAVAEIVSLPRQIERDEANMMVILPPEPSSVAESGTAPSSLIEDGVAGVDQPPAAQEPVQNIDAENAAEAEADLERLLAVAEIVSLPRQIERDEANVMVRRRPEPSSVAESGTAPSSLTEDGVAGAPQHPSPQSPVLEAVAADASVPEVVGILAGAEAQVEVEVAIEAFPSVMLELISNVARRPQFATADMTVTTGGLESNLEERLPVHDPKAGDPSPDIQTEGNTNSTKDDVENLQVEEPLPSA